MWYCMLSPLSLQQSSSSSVISSGRLATQRKLCVCSRAYWTSPSSNQTLSRTYPPDNRYTHTQSFPKFLCKEHTCSNTCTHIQLVSPSRIDWWWIGVTVLAVYPKPVHQCCLFFVTGIKAVLGPSPQSALQTGLGLVTLHTTWILC